MFFGFFCFFRARGLFKKRGIIKRTTLFKKDTFFGDVFFRVLRNEAGGLSSEAGRPPSEVEQDAEKDAPKNGGEKTKERDFCRVKIFPNSAKNPLKKTKKHPRLRRGVRHPR